MHTDKLIEFENLENVVCENDYVLTLRGWKPRAVQYLRLLLLQKATRNRRYRLNLKI
jgi:hypothetical protein